MGVVEEFQAAWRIVSGGRRHRVDGHRSLAALELVDCPYLDPSRAADLRQRELDRPNLCVVGGDDEDVGRANRVQGTVLVLPASAQQVEDEPRDTNGFFR
jgi:hypothetical protein